MEQDDPRYHYIAQSGTQFKTDELFTYGNFFPFSIFRFPMNSVVNKTTDKKALLYSSGFLGSTMVKSPLPGQET